MSRWEFFLVQYHFTQRVCHARFDTVVTGQEITPCLSQFNEQWKIKNGQKKC
jgi:hypothetical protein